MRFRCLILVVLALHGSGARAGDLPGAGSATSPVDGDSHGWLAVPARVGAAIYHIPPRAADASGRRGSEDGSLRLAVNLAQMPQALGATDHTLYMVFPPSAMAGGSTSRQVLMVDAMRGSMDGAWVGDPGGDRLPSLPALPGEGELRGFVGTPAGPVALMARSGHAERLLVLAGDSWVEVPLPSEAGNSTLRLVGTAAGITVISFAGDQAVAWMKSHAARPRSGPPEGPWTSHALSFRDRETLDVVLPAGEVLHVRGQYIYDRRRGEDVEIRAATESGSRTLAVVSAVAPGYAVAPLDQTGRVAVVWRAADLRKESAARVPERTRIAEVSVFTGQVLFCGDAEARPLFSAFDLKVLAAFLVTVMLAIVVFVLRPDKAESPVSLPKGVSLAEPGRRLWAALIDAGLAALIASGMTGIGVGEALSLQALTGRADIVTLYLAMIAVGMVLGSLGEWLFGRTVGKVLVGAETVRAVVTRSPDGQVEPGVGRVSLRRAIVRNIVKWVLPPVAMSGLSSPDRRHRGDTAAGTVVIVRDDPAGA